MALSGTISKNSAQRATLKEKKHGPIGLSELSNYGPREIGLVWVIQIKTKLAPGYTQTLGLMQTKLGQAKILNDYEHDQKIGHPKNTWIGNRDKINLVVIRSLSTTRQEELSILEQLDQLYKLFSNFQNFGQSTTNASSGSLAYKDNHLSALITTYQTTITWIIDSDAPNHMTDAHHLFTTYLSCVKNLKVRIANGSLSSIVKKERKNSNF